MRCFLFFLIGFLGFSNAMGVKDAYGHPIERGLSQEDSSYGRLERPAALCVGAGTTVDSWKRFRSILDGRFRYLDTIGIFVNYEEGSLFDESAPSLRVLAGGFELRPLFLIRWITGSTFGNPRCDLLLDSLELEFGLFGAQVRKAGRLEWDRGFQAGLGLEFPIFPSAQGLWLGAHTGMRWTEVSFEQGTPQGPASYISLTLSWHQFIPFFYRLTN
ncbi:hypothetical protein [Pajaroellobacter abortibovis]|uniref:Outer membrane protein beta-barrel domain-containing protein n=1 Tax=Pajaroellobacter abortibovis TaxID=1882918 RepID=A0A1L6MVC2_9BACT|nr:hypothetical protein [Pajaroellobacter abortibovis]APR99464.1 hypothetical protein BCY86_01290 [Pajaroellobacter abortibovis]